MSKLQARDETIIQASSENIWSLITDIRQFHKINPGLVSATGSMNTLEGIRECVINNRGKTGKLTEKMIEMIPGKRTVWTIVADDMGWSKMLKETKFCINLEPINEKETRVVNETYYLPANFFARIMNGLVMKKMIRKAQAQILANIKSLTEN